MSEFDPFARYYDADYADHTEDIEFYRQMARRCNGPVLELMCGSGRVLLPLARDGHTITGLDLSPAMLSCARSRLEAEGLSDRVTLVEGNVTNFSLDGHFDLAFIALNSFLHLEDPAAQLMALHCIHRHLTPGGLLLIDLFNPDPRSLLADESVLQYDKTFMLPNGRRVQKYLVQQRNLAAQTQLVTFIYDELDDEGHVRRELLPFTLRWVYRYELEHLLARAGFRVEVVYGSYDLDPYESGCSQLLTVASRANAIS